MKRAPQLQFDADVVVHRSADPLLAAEVAFFCLHGNAPEKELNLVQFSARCAAQLRARTPQIMGRYLGNSEFRGVLFYDMPDYSFRYAVTPVFARPTDTSDQSSGRNSGRGHPEVDGTFDSFGNRYGSNMAAGCRPDPLLPKFSCGGCFEKSLPVAHRRVSLAFTRVGLPEGKRAVPVQQ